MLNFTKKIFKKLLLFFPANTIGYFFDDHAKPLFVKKVILKNSVDINLYSFGNHNKDMQLSSGYDLKAKNTMQENFRQSLGIT